MGVVEKEKTQEPCICTEVSVSVPGAFVEKAAEY